MIELLQSPSPVVSKGASSSGSRTLLQLVLALMMEEVVVCLTLECEGKYKMLY